MATLSGIYQQGIPPTILQRLGVRYGGAPDPRLGYAPPPANSAAMAMAGRLGIPVGDPRMQQAPPPPGGDPSTPPPAATGINAPGVQRQPGTQQQALPGAGNAQQMTPQAMAMIQEFMRQRARSAAQKMIDDRGVFAGQQQGVTMPSFAMPPAPTRGAPPGGAMPPNPYAAQQAAMPAQTAPGLSAPLNTGGGYI